MATYILNLYYPNLREYARNVRTAKEFVESVSSKNDWRMLKAGENLCSIAFRTDADPRDFEARLREIGEENFHFLVLEVSAVHAGWTSKSVYEWLEGHLRKDSGKLP